MPMPLILFTSTWMYYKESRPIRGGFFAGYGGEKL